MQGDVLLAEPVQQGVIESTYGNRSHPHTDPETELAAAIKPVIARGGVIVVPAFAVGRTQLLLYLLARLKARGAIPDIPVFLNSPMATDATRIYHEHRHEHRLTDEQCRAMCTAAVFVNSVEESKGLNERRGPAVIVAASGMAAEATPEVKQSALAFVDSVSGSYGSCVQSALLAGIELARSSGARRNAIIYLGDGGGHCQGADEATHLSQTLEAVTRANGGTARIHAIGVLDIPPVNWRFLTDLASRNGGTFTMIR